MSDQIVYGGTIDVLDNASAQTLSAYGNRISAPSWSPSVSPGAGTAGKLRIRVKDGPGVGNKWTFNFQLNGVTQFSVEIGAGTNTGYSASTFAVAAGDRLEIEVVPDSSPTATNVCWCWTWTPTTADNTMLCVTTDTGQLSGGSAAEQLAVSGAMPGARPNNISLYFPMAGTLTALYALVSAAPGIGNRLRRFYVYVDSVLQAALNVDISGADTTGNATGASIAVADGQPVRIQSRCIGIGDPDANAAYVSLGLAFTPAWPDFFLVGATSDDAMPLGSAIEYRQPCTGGASWNADYYTAFAVTHRVELERMRVRLATLPSSGLYVVARSGGHTSPQLTFAPGSAQSQLAVMPTIINEGDQWSTLVSAQAAVGSAKASVCYAMRVPPDEGAPFTF